MEQDNVCIFCGQKPGAFRSTYIQCGRTQQFACKTCEKEMKGLEEAEVCRRALVRGRAKNPELIRERIGLLTEAEDHRLKCLRCGANLKFGQVENLDNSPMRDSILSSTFDVLPAFCEACGKYEFYHPDVIRKNKYLNYLIWKDNQK